MAADGAIELDDGRALLAQRIEVVFERLTAVSIVNVFNSTLITLVMARDGFRFEAGLWLALVTMLNLARIIACRIYRNDQERRENVHRWAGLSVAGSLASGLLWGGGALMLFSHDPTDQWLWSLAIGGMCAGATSLHAAHLPTALSFSIPACVPLLVRLALRGTDEGLAAAVLIVAFIVVTTFTAMRFSAQFGETFGLNRALEQRTAELDEANRRLRKEMEDHRRTSEILHHSQKLEALGSLTGGMAHDFNNLLAVILGNLELIDRRAKDTHIATLAKTAVGAVESGAALISSLLSFARKQTLRPQPADINQLIGDFRPLLLRAAGSSAKLEVDSQAEDASAMIDTAQFQAALLNLVINARDAVREGGRIIIRISHCRFEGPAGPDRPVPPGAFIRIDVIDDGIGMSRDEAAKAFEPFFTTKGIGKGSGLGLSQIYGFALQSGGYASLESRQGTGTTVSLFLPRLQASPGDPGPDQIALAKLTNRPRLLLVDDNADVLVTLRQGLVDAGWDVMIAQDASAALVMLDHHKDIDILVSDIDMPTGMSGIELVNAMKTRCPSLPAVLISGAAVPMDKIPPDVAYLAKPFSLQKFLTTLSSAKAAA